MNSPYEAQTESFVDLAAYEAELEYEKKLIEKGPLLLRSVQRLLIATDGWYSIPATDIERHRTAISVVSARNEVRRLIKEIHEFNGFQRKLKIQRLVAESEHVPF